MRYGYFGYEHRKTSINDVHLEHIGFAEVNPVLGKHSAYAAKLQEWGVTLLRTGNLEAGVFSFCYGEVDDFEGPGETFAELYLSWDGEEAYGSRSWPAVPEKP